MAREALRTERFDVVRAVGAGAMGIVYEARDRATGERVALKALHELDGHALYRLKNEFRHLQGVMHDHLVRLRELVAEDGEWYLVMDFVDGLDIVSYIRGAAPEERMSTVDGKNIPPLSPTKTPEGSNGEALVNYHDVRRLTAQVASGLHAVHGAGCVHRDIKPSNILVNRSGRAVLLDFGLVMQRSGVDSMEGTMVGTVPYMAPEQALGTRAGPSADCYALGVVLFELLTGRWPHSGSLMEMVMAKQTTPAPSPQLLAPTIPSDLDGLCGELLDRDPDRRPAAADVVRRLTGEASQPEGRRSLVATRSQGARFVGRQAQLDLLAAALNETRRRGARLVWIRGESGVGKSALLRRFIDDMRMREDGTVILQARCYERELLPFKAVDGIVDALSTFLRSLPSADAAALLPRHASVLRLAFPVLARVDAIARVPAPMRPVQDPHERRQRAFQALRELLGRVAESRPLVLVVDDLQWGDADSVQLLQEALRPPEAPPVLLVLASRDDDAADALVTKFEELSGPVQRLRLGALDEDMAIELAKHLIEDAGLGPRVSALAIASESGGHPLHLQELVRYAATAPALDRERPRIDQAIGLRIDGLSDLAHLLLRLVVVAAAPIAIETLAMASGAGPEQIGGVIAELQASCLLRSAGGGAGRVEPYHDRVREALLASLDDSELLQLHHRLASALEGSQLAAARPEVVLVHCRACGRLDAAAAYAERAARMASDALAFGRAAELYALALSLSHGDRESKLRLRVALAEALVQAGRLREAADEFLAAASGADRQLAMKLRINALEQILRSGQLERGLALAESALAGVGVRLPRGPRSALLSVLLGRFRLAVGGIRYVERPPDQIPAGELEATDLLWSVYSGLVFADPMIARGLSTRLILRALRTGDAERIALGLSTVAGIRSFKGRTSHDAVTHYASLALEVARRSGSPHAISVALTSRGLARYLCGMYVEALHDFESSAELLREQTIGARWEIDITEVYRAVTLVVLGRLNELDCVVSRLLTEAVQGGDEYLAINLRAMRANLLWLVRDAPEEGRWYVEEAQRMTRAQSQRFSLSDFYYLCALANIDLYQGDAASARRRVEEAWPGLRRSHLLGIQRIHTEVAFLRIRTAVALAQQLPARRAALFRDAKRTIGSLKGSDEREALASLGRAMIAAVEKTEEAMPPVTEALLRLDACGLALYAHAARLRFGALLGAGGEALRSEADAYMTSQRVTNPVALSRVFVPV